MAAPKDTRTPVGRPSPSGGVASHAAPARPPAPPMEPAEPEVWTIGRVLRWTQGRFAARALGSPRLDAELLLAHCLGRARVALYTHFDQPLGKDELGRFRDLIKRRLAGTPVAYLIGEKEFFGLPLRVTEAVLIPRPETELLVEVALRLLPGGPTATDAPAVDEPTPAVGAAEPGVELHIAYDEPVEYAEPTAESETEATAAPTATPAAAAVPAGPPVASMVDVGTGSGAVAISVAHRRRDVRVVAIDRSPAALAVARENAERHGVAIELIEGDLLAPLGEAGRGFDLITANLPYIPTADIAGLSPEVRSEPHQALDGGPDGLDLVRRLIGQAGRHLAPGGAIALEIGAGQADTAEELLRKAGFVDVRSEADLARIPRVVLGRRPR